ncbi:Abi family protein [Thauera sp. 2A1]|uniref:Abi family protein n=1 Tax=Thauera sp. 2A1 TaxID=2570191 RepID=UPI001292826D|nr:Abi family protein [Thauera sp. 2A1]KAI5912975.1 Abi family protein [Thauera sp. 2A1]
MTHLSPPKPFKSYPDLVELLRLRGMSFDDAARAERKLAQVGYYRLSGFWYVCRAPGMGSGSAAVRRADRFLPGTEFDRVLSLYLMDKRLRLLMLDAIERIEVHVRSVIAHEVGYHDPLAYQCSDFINPSQTRTYSDRSGRQRNAWIEWTNRQTDQLNRSREDCIEWHRRSHKAIPFWVAVEAWDFGVVSKYYEMLKRRYQNRVAERLGVNNPAVLRAWLHEINILRNRCAHHCRIWNQSTSNPLPVLDHAYFKGLGMETDAGSRLLGLIVVIWFLVRKIGPNSEWIHEVAEVVAAKPALPGCSFAAMGFANESGFPEALLHNS